MITLCDNYEKCIPFCVIRSEQKNRRIVRQYDPFLADHDKNTYVNAIAHDFLLHI